MVRNMRNMILGPTFDRIASVRIHLLTSKSTFRGACICTAHGQLLHSSKLAVEMFSCWLSQSLSWKMPWKAMKGQEMIIPIACCCFVLILESVGSGDWKCFVWKNVVLCFTSFSAGPAQDQLQKRAWQRSKRVADSSLNSASHWHKARVEKAGRAMDRSFGRVPVLTNFILFLVSKAPDPHALQTQQDPPMRSQHVMTTRETLQFLYLIGT